jgi:hypothetical protein
MATTTTNFGWDIPRSTDLVKDGATAIAALGQDIDTALVDLKGGTTGQVLAKASNTDLDYTWVTDPGGDITGVTAGTGISGGGTSGTVTVTNSMATAITTAGDVIYGTGSGTFTRLGIGTAGQVLQVNSGATAPQWSTSASGGMTLLSTTTLSGSSTVSITGISTAYTDLVIDFYGITNASNTDYNINPNGNAGITDVVRGGTTLQQLNDGQLRILNNIAGPLASSTDNSCRLIIANYSATTAGGKPFDLWGGFIGSDSSKQINHVRGRIKTTSAITQLDFVAGSNWTAGTVKIYGVK